MIDWAEVVESGRAIMAAPRLGQAGELSRGPEDEKFALGDLLCDVADDRLDGLAHEIGHNLTGAQSQVIS